MSQGSSNPTIDIKKVAGTVISTSAGNMDAGTLRVAIATNQTSIPITDNGGSITVDGTFWQTTQPVSLTSTTITGTVAVTDNAGSITVDAPVATPVFVRLSSGTAAVDTLPVSGPLTDTQLRATAVPVSLASVPSHAVTNAGTFAVQATLAAGTNAIGTVEIGATSLSALETISVTNLSQLGGTAISMNTGVRDAGTQRVTIATNDSVPVTGTFWQTTQPVSLASVPSHAVTNAGTFAVQAAQSGTWTVQPGNTANTTPWLTKSFETLGTATAIVALNGNVSQPLSGALGSAVTVTAIATPVGFVITPYTSYDGGTNWVVSKFYDPINEFVEDTIPNASLVVGFTRIVLAGDGATHVKVQATSFTSGSATFRLSSSNSQGVVNSKSNAVHDAASGTYTQLMGGYASSTAPTAVGAGDAARIWTTLNGAVNVADGGGSITVDGTFWQTTQPVSLASVPTHGVTGTFWQATQPVSIATLPTLAAGTNNIGDVDVLSVIPGTGTTNLGKQTDSAAGATDTGVAILAIRDDALTTLTPVDGDYTRFRVNSIGRLWTSSTIDAALPAGTNAIGSITNTSFAATQSGTWTVQPGNTANTTPWLTKINDGTNSASIKAASTAAVATDTALVVAVSPNNSVTVSQATASNLNATVTGTVELGATSLAALENISVTIPGTVDLGTVSLTALETITVTQSTASSFLNKPYGYVTTAAPTYTTGTDNALSLTTNGSLRVDVMSSIPAGTNAIGKLAANDGVDIGDVTINNASIAVTGTFWQTTQPVSLASVPSHAVTNAGTFAVQATLAAETTKVIGTVNISSGQTIGAVTAITNALPAGTNAIGKLAANSGVDIGDVDVLSIVPGTAATNLGKAVDSAAGATDTGTLMLAVRDDALAALTPIDGDYTQLRVTNQGRLWTSSTIDAALPAGTNAIGSITNTSFAATQSGTWNIGSITTLPTVSITANSAVNVAQMGGVATTMGNGVSGTGVQRVTIASDSTGQTKLTDGTNTATVKAASTAAVAADTALVVSVSPNSPVTMKGYDAGDDMLKVKSVQKKFRDSFIGAAVNAGNWTTTLGTGGTATVASGALTFGSGTTINSTSNLLSVETFTVPFRVSVGMTLSQRVANQTFYVEAVSVNATTGVPDGLHSCGFAFDGTTVTQGKYFVQNGGLTALTSAASTFPTTASGSVYELEPYADEVWFHGGVLDAASGRSNSYRRHQQIPDPNAVYKLRLRWLNGGVAPTNTNAVFQYVACQDYAELTAEITAGRGQTVAGQAIGVAVVSAPTTAVTGTFWQATQPISGTVTANVNVGGTHDSAAGTVGALGLGYAYGVAVADNTLPAISANADAARFLTNKNGAQVVVQLPEATQAYAPTNATTTAYAASLIAKASAGTLYMVTGYNSNLNSQFIQIHDSATLPANGVAPKVIFIVPGESNFSFDLGSYGRYFAAGITICNSTTGPTKTIGAADCWLDVQYK